MERMHPNQQKAQLRSLLAVDQVVTTAQLERWGLLNAATWLDLPRVLRTCRTRVTQSESDLDLTFVALEQAVLAQAPRELMHLCGLAEARRDRVFVVGEHWQHVRVKGRRKSHQPDAEIVQVLDHTRRSDCAVEFDAGYAPARITQKLEAACESGYTRILWATSIHGRTRSVLEQAAQLQRQGRLPELRQMETRFVNFWVPVNPYQPRPRCSKPVALSRTFTATGG